MALRLVRVLAIGVVAVISACQSDSSTDATTLHPTPSRITVIGGNNQQADPQDSLPTAVRFLISDPAGRPLSNVAVRFAVPLGGGSVPDTMLMTDSTGIVSTGWFMGPNGGVQTLEAHVAALVATANATTCDPDSCYPQENLSSTLSAATLVTLATYDNSGQAVHPDVLRGHGSATGFWMAITPYPGGNSFFENPSIFRSTDAVRWLAPPGVPNPVVQPALNGYLSDPDLVANTDNHLWLYYRSVVSGSNIVMLTRSADGVHWDIPAAVVSVPSHELVSPTVVRAAPQAAWQMWSVNTGGFGCTAPTTSIEHRSSTDGIHWGAIALTDLAQPGQNIWHIDVQWVAARSEYWAMYNTYQAGGSCATDGLYIARSTDGIHWKNYPSPIARAWVIPAFQSIVYRSTFLFNPKATEITLWISGAQLVPAVGYDWRTATVSLSTADLIAIASIPQTSLQQQGDRSHLPPPEPDGPVSH
jgi:hypothetical protein